MKPTLSIILLLVHLHLITAQVGIGTTTPTQELDVNGSVNVENQLFIKGSDAVNTGENISILGISTAPDGEVKEIDNPIFNFMTYTFTNVDEDQITNFNTLIPADQYTLAIIGHIFNDALEVVNDSFGATNVRAFVENGTWRITADHPVSGTIGNVSGTWIIDCMAVLTTGGITNNVGVISQDMNNNPVADAGVAPF